MNISIKSIAAIIFAGLLATSVGITPASAQPGQETSSIATIDDDVFHVPDADIMTSCTVAPNGAKSVNVDAALYNFGTEPETFEVFVYLTNNGRKWVVEELGEFVVQPYEESVTIRIANLSKNFVKYGKIKYKKIAFEVRALDLATLVATDTQRIKDIRKHAVCNRMLPGEGVEGL